MTFDTAAYLRRATGRAKSDVANKMIGMFLHDVSRRLCSRLECGVSDPSYVDAVAKAFGVMCSYCGRGLEDDRASVEHLDGMNRFRAGLHIPGNVIVSCTKCNREKRRDDSNPKLTLAKTGWESFLSHDATQCPGTCRSCGYWARVWSNPDERSQRLKASLKNVRQFREKYISFVKLSERARPLLMEKMESIYRDCQSFAESRIKDAVTQVMQDFDQ